MRGGDAVRGSGPPGPQPKSRSLSRDRFSSWKCGYADTVTPRPTTGRRPRRAGAFVSTGPKKPRLEGDRGRADVVADLVHAEPVRLEQGVVVLGRVHRVGQRRGRPASSSAASIRRGPAPPCGCRVPRAVYSGARTPCRGAARRRCTPAPAPTPSPATRGSLGDVPVLVEDPPGSSRARSRHVAHLLHLEHPAGRDPGERARGSNQKSALAKFQLNRRTKAANVRIRIYFRTRTVVWTRPGRIVSVPS